MLHIVALLERRFPRRGSTIALTLLLGSALALLAGLLVAASGPG